MSDHKKRTYILMTLSALFGFFLCSFFAVGIIQDLGRQVNECKQHIGEKTK